MVLARLALLALPPQVLDPCVVACRLLQKHIMPLQAPITLSRLSLLPRCPMRSRSLLIINLSNHRNLVVFLTRIMVLMRVVCHLHHLPRLQGSKALQVMDWVKDLCRRTDVLAVHHQKSVPLWRIAQDLRAMHTKGHISIILILLLVAALLVALLHQHLPWPQLKQLRETATTVRQLCLRNEFGSGRRITII